MAQWRQIIRLRSATFNPLKEKLLHLHPARTQSIKMYLPPLSAQQEDLPVLAASRTLVEVMLAVYSHAVVLGAVSRTYYVSKKRLK